MEIFRRTPLDQGRLETCRQWADFDNAVSHAICGDFSTDLWLMLSSYEPDLNDDPVARAAMDALLDVPEIGILRKACAGDPALSAAVTVMLRQFSTQCGQAVKRAEQESGQPSPGDNPQPGDSESDSDSDGQGKGKPQPGSGSSQQLAPETKQALKEAIQRAAKDALDGKHTKERVADIAAGFSLTGDPNPSLRDRLEIAASDTRNLHLVLKLVGTLRKTVAETGRYIRATAPNATLPKPGYGGGLRALGMLAPGEIAAITTPGVTEDLFWQRWKNRHVKVTKTWGKVPAGAGPIVLMGDESSSMPAQFAGFPDTHPSLTAADWLTALALATAEQCEAERRPFVYQAWSGRISQDRRFESQDFGGLTPAQKIKMATEHSGGGTNLHLAVERGITEAVKLSRGRKVKADVLVVTDGSWVLNRAAIESINRRLEETRIKVHLFLVCNNADPSKINKAFWTSIVSVSDMLSSSVAVGKIMA